ncbi:ABC transporter permease subunit [Pseudomonas sp. 14P_8.1_Bac3]|uniref:ABC transporter permease n=1 Tax=Pseudomonas sp. 14P_8.1_Bac3 TaxID=2971621 RepID=UPI0021C5D7EC|nr:ABC transporter permease subunit [Pseudomonas sp. 14P_8.1_Bac3]MCU1763182.1 ABC transporter permease subunit [Pseudomonas sp. 14P_8.1_Bac3]
MLIDTVFLSSTLLQLLQALPMTLALFSASVIIGTLLAMLVVWLRVCHVAALRHVARGYVFLFRGSPLLIQMFLMYYGLSQFQAVRQSLFWPVLREPVTCAVIALALCTAGYMAEIFRGGLLAVPPQQVEAARATGMSGWLLARRIIIPIALRSCLPAYSTEVILMVKATSLASLVTVYEVSGVAQRIISETYRTMEVFLCAALIYLLLNFLIVRTLALIEWRLSPRPPAGGRPTIKKYALGMRRG